jgi:hypothetical protein
VKPNSNGQNIFPTLVAPTPLPDENGRQEEGDSVDKNDPDPANRGRPLMGIEMIRGFKPGPDRPGPASDPDGRAAVTPLTGTRS